MQNPKRTLNHPQCKHTYRGVKAAGSSTACEFLSPQGTKKISGTTCYPKKTKSYNYTSLISLRFLSLG